jgi:hypothetical protein
LTRLDGKRPDGLTLIPWQTGRPLARDVTVASTLADSYTLVSAGAVCAVAELAATRKISKYTEITTSNWFQPVAIENLGPINSSAIDFLCEIGHRFSSTSGDEREPAFLFQRISIAVQRFNSILLHNSFEASDEPNL